MATAALRGILVVGAVILGVIVMLKAFPESSAPAATTAVTSPAVQPTAGLPETALPPTTSPGAAQSPAAPTQAPVVKGVRVQVLNGTDTSGIAAKMANTLEKAGYKIIAVGNAQRTYDVTTIFYRPDSQAQAQQVEQSLLPGARLEPANNNLAKNLQLTIVLGKDFADKQQ